MGGERGGSAMPLLEGLFPGKRVCEKDKRSLAGGGQPNVSHGENAPAWNGKLQRQEGEKGREGAKCLLMQCSPSHPAPTSTSPREREE